MRARKRFGQHFLNDRSVIERILAAIDPKPEERIVEIGPGLGAITVPLLQRRVVLAVIEIDRDAIAELRIRTAGLGELSIYEADALEFDLGRIGAPAHALRVVGNLPYNISTPLLFRLLTQVDHIRDMHFMLQKEVVDRITAAPGDDAYGRLTVMLAPHVKAEALFNIDSSAFRPAPKVLSTFFRLTPHASAPFAIEAPDAYAQVVAAAFSQRRKTLRNALKDLLTEAEIRSSGIDPALRAEVIAPQGYAALGATLVSKRALDANKKSRQDQP